MAHVVREVTGVYVVQGHVYRRLDSTDIRIESFFFDNTTFQSHVVSTLSLIYTKSSLDLPAIASSVAHVSTYCKVEHVADHLVDLNLAQNEVDDDE